MLEVSLLFWRRLAVGLVLTGLGAVAAINLAKQDQTAARNAVLWQVLEYLEKEAPPQARVAWVGSADETPPSEELLITEEFQFKSHLYNRGRVDIQMVWIAPEEEGKVTDWPVLILTGSRAPKTAGDCRLLREFETPYWAGQRRYKHCLWIANAARTKDAALNAGSGKP
jgi:hypothetical protein